MDQVALIRNHRPSPQPVHPPPHDFVSQLPSLRVIGLHRRPLHRLDPLVPGSSGGTRSRRFPPRPLLLHQRPAVSTGGNPRDPDCSGTDAGRHRAVTDGSTGDGGPSADTIAGDEVEKGGLDRTFCRFRMKGTGTIPPKLRTYTTETTSKVCGIETTHADKPNRNSIWSER